MHPPSPALSANHFSPHAGVDTISMYYDLHGYTAQVHVADPSAHHPILQILEAFAVPDTNVAADCVSYTIARDNDAWVVSSGDVITHRTDTLTSALMAIEWHLVTDMLAFRRDLFHLHGAALLTPDARSSLLILGASGSGKTTLTLGLMARGFLPFADDVILMEPATLELHPFQRAFHVDEGTIARINGLHSTPAWRFDDAPPGYFVPPRWAEQTAPVRFVFLPTLQPDAPPSVTPLSVADAVIALLPFSQTLAGAPSLALAVAARLAAQASCFRLVTGDLEATTRLVATLVEEQRTDNTLSQ